MAIYINNEKMKPMSYMEPDLELDEEDMDPILDFPFPSEEPEEPEEDTRIPVPVEEQV